MITLTQGHVAVAKRIITACEADLGRKLSNGECVDLLLDNTQWDRLFTLRVLRAYFWEGAQP